MTRALPRFFWTSAAAWLAIAATCAGCAVSVRDVAITESALAPADDTARSTPATEPTDDLPAGWCRYEDYENRSLARHRCAEGFGCPGSIADSTDVACVALPTECTTGLAALLTELGDRSFATRESASRRLAECCTHDGYASMLEGRRDGLDVAAPGYAERSRRIVSVAGACRLKARPCGARHVVRTEGACNYAYAETRVEDLPTQVSCRGTTRLGGDVTCTGRLVRVDAVPTLADGRTVLDAPMCPETPPFGPARSSQVTVPVPPEDVEVCGWPADLRLAWFLDRLRPGAAEAACGLLRDDVRSEDVPVVACSDNPDRPIDASSEDVVRAPGL